MASGIVRCAISAVLEDRNLDLESSRIKCLRTVGAELLKNLIAQLYNMLTILLDVIICMYILITQRNILCHVILSNHYIILCHVILSYALLLDCSTHILLSC